MMLKKAAIAGVTVAAALLVSPGAANAIEIPEPPAIPAPSLLSAEQGTAAEPTESESTTEEESTSDSETEAPAEETPPVEHPALTAVEGEVAAVEEEAGGFMGFLHGIPGLSSLLG